MEDYPKSVTKRCTQTILDQMNNNFIYKIKEEDGNYSNGFFCHIKYQSKNIPVVIINNNIIKDDIINVLINDEIKTIKLRKAGIIYHEYNISIIEIEKNMDYNINYLELDNNIYKNDSELNYYKESIYIINYNNKDISVTYGIINDINKLELKYIGNIDINSHGLPIFNLSNNKIIGIHINKSKYYNKGIFFKYIELINKYKNEIDIIIDIKQEHINNEIYFLNNNDEYLKELNKNNTKLYINNKKYEYKKYFIP